eukprot:2127851-Alexandrium_andersonii.AAC.1
MQARPSELCQHASNADPLRGIALPSQNLCLRRADIVRSACLRLAASGAQNDTRSRLSSASA